jgi:hypothetical protein
MAFENFPAANEEQSRPLPQKSNAPMILKTSLIVAILGLIGTWGYIIWDKNKTNDTIQQKDNLFATASTQRDELQKELDETTLRYDELKTNDTRSMMAKDSMLNRRDREIAETKSKIQSILSKSNATKAELAQAKTLIASLNSSITDYKAQVETLMAANTQLTTEKEEVTQQRNKVQRNYDSATVVIKQKEDVIDVGSTLHASNFSIVGINEKNSGREKATTTAKKIDKLRVTFDLDENRITPSGAKDIYVIIYAPDGTPVSVEALGSGTFTTRDGQTKPFTNKLNVDYNQGERKTLNFDWKQNSNFVVGDYKIEVYQNGFKIGEGVRHFKKGGLFS